MPSEYQLSITRLIDELKSGDEKKKNEAIAKLWETYFERLCAVARKHLTSKAKRVNDADDVLVSVFDALHGKVIAGDSLNALDRDSLWQVLLRMTLDNAIKRNRSEGRHRRGGANTPEPLIEELISKEPTADDVELFEELMDGLIEPDLIRIASMRLEGHSIEEIALELDLSERTIQRKLRVIKDRWTALVDR